ncbi:hypothetical protein Trydic_g13255 [Trypoxylus dichotomus]
MFDSDAENETIFLQFVDENEESKQEEEKRAENNVETVTSLDWGDFNADHLKTAVSSQLHSRTWTSRRRPQLSTSTCPKSMKIWQKSKRR